jgi:hypothetical protein
VVRSVHRAVLAACILMVLGCANRSATPAPPIVTPMPPLADPAPAAPAQPEPQPAQPEPQPAQSEELPPAVAVAFNIDPVVGQAPPTLHFTVHNISKIAAPLVVFDDPRCTAHYLLDLRIARGGKPVALAACAVKDWPGRDESLPPDQRRKFSIPLADLAASWPRGAYTLAVRWDPLKLNDANAGAAVVRATQSSFNAEGFTIARPLADARVERGQIIKLPDGARLKFTGHSHKSVGPGESSPLMIYGELTPPGGAKPEQFSLNLHTEETRLFTLQGGLVFELADYAYDDWMQLRYYGRLAASP